MNKTERLAGVIAETAVALYGPDAETKVSEVFDVIEPNRLGELAQQLVNDGGICDYCKQDVTGREPQDGCSHNQGGDTMHSTVRLSSESTLTSALLDQAGPRWPEGAVIVSGCDGPAGPYAIALDGEYRDQTGFATYADALDHLRIAVADALVCEPAGEIGDVPVTYLNMTTGLKIELPRLPDIAEDWDRPTDDDLVARWPDGSVAVEAFCALCGETCNPHGPDDMTHAVRLQSDEQPCGGPLVPVGWWK